MPVPVSSTQPCGKLLSRNRVLDQFLRLPLHRRQRRRPLERASRRRGGSPDAPRSRAGAEPARSARTGPARSCRRRPWPAAGTAGSLPRCRASSCRCRSCSRRSSPRELTTSASSGSGTFHFESLRMRTGWPVAAHAVRRGLEEQLRPRRVVDAIVEVAAARRLRLLHPRRAAAEVGDAGGPDFLRSDRRQQRRRDRAVAVDQGRRRPSAPAPSHADRPD